MKSKGIPPKMALIQLRICNKFPRWTDHLEGLDIFWWGSFLRVGLKNSDFFNEQQNNHLNFPRTSLRNVLYFKGLLNMFFFFFLVPNVSHHSVTVSREANIRPQLFWPPTGHEPRVPFGHEHQPRVRGWS